MRSYNQIKGDLPECVGEQRHAPGNRRIWLCWQTTQTPLLSRLADNYSGSNDPLLVF